jgi:hypothetical protein
MKRPALRGDPAESWSIECLCVLRERVPRKYPHRSARQLRFKRVPPD